MSGDRMDPADDARLGELLATMRAYHDGESSARVPVVPGESGRIAELCRLFNALAERGELLERRAEPARRDAAAAEDLETPEQSRGPVILVLEDAAAPERREPMRAAAEAAVRGLGGAWDRADVFAAQSAADVHEAVARGVRVVCALLDARAERGMLAAVTDALESAAPDASRVYFAPEGDAVALEHAAEIALGRDRTEIARSIGHAAERLTLHWLTTEPAQDGTGRDPDPHFRRSGFSGEKVLIVDDDVRNVFAMVSALELHGLTALTADSGYEALEVLGGNPDVSVVLMDLMMPGLDGYATAARIRRRPASARIPIVAVTARAAAEDRARSLAAGMAEHVTKPVEIEHLLDVIGGLIKS